VGHLTKKKSENRERKKRKKQQKIFLGKKTELFQQKSGKKVEGNTQRQE